MFCHKCGNKVAVVSMYCNKCGTKLAVQAEGHRTPIAQPDMSLPELVQHENQDNLIHATDSSPNNEQQATHSLTQAQTVELLKEAMFEAASKCFGFAVLGVLVGIPGLLGIVGLVLGLATGDTEALLMDLAMGLLLTPIGVIIIAVARRCKMEHSEFKHHKKEAELNENYQLPYSIMNMARINEKIGKISEQQGKRAFRRMFGQFGD